MYKCTERETGEMDIYCMSVWRRWRIHVALISPRPCRGRPGGFGSMRALRGLRVFTHFVVGMCSIPWVYKVNHGRVAGESGFYCA